MYRSQSCLISLVDRVLIHLSQDTARHQLLQRACHAHNVAARNATIGKAIDRHLLGLRLQLRPDESSPLLSDDLFYLSQEWKLSTSGLSAGDRFLATGYARWPPDRLLSFASDNSIGLAQSALMAMGLIVECIRPIQRC
jgi:hypothetical protein